MVKINLRVYNEDQIIFRISSLIVWIFLSKSIRKDNNQIIYTPENQEQIALSSRVPSVRHKSDLLQSF